MGRVGNAMVVCVEAADTAEPGGGPAAPDGMVTPERAHRQDCRVGGPNVGSAGV